MSIILIDLGSFATAIAVALGPMVERKMKGVLSFMNRFQRMKDHVAIDERRTSDSTNLVSLPVASTQIICGT